MAITPTCKDFVWTQDTYDVFLDATVLEQTLSHPYYKEWTIRELIDVPNKWNLVTAKYPTFPRTRPDAAAVVRNSVNNIAADSLPPPHC